MAKAVAPTFGELWASDCPDLCQPVAEHRFHPVRKWRFDWAWIKERVAVEDDGGQWAPRGGRHNTDADREKLNEAAAAGWRVIRFSSAMRLNDPGACVDVVRRAIGE